MAIKFVEFTISCPFKFVMAIKISKVMLVSFALMAVLFFMIMKLDGFIMMSFNLTRNHWQLIFYGRSGCNLWP